MTRHLGFLVLLALLSVAPSIAFGFGELTFEPGFFFRAQKLDASRFGLYIQEDIEPKWFYSSWTGSGKVFAYVPGANEVWWYSTSHDINYNLTSSINVGAGAGFTVASPSNIGEGDIHLKFSARLW